MPFGEITKQLAQQALGSQVKDLLDPAKPAPSQPESTGATILAQIQAMQRALKPEEELVVLFHSGAETIRVLEFFVPTWQVIVLTGLDTARNIARVISPADTLQLVCKVMKAPEKPVRIGFKTPKP